MEEQKRKALRIEQDKDEEKKRKENKDKKKETPRTNDQDRVIRSKNIIDSVSNNRQSF